MDLEQRLAPLALFGILSELTSMSGRNSRPASKLDSAYARGVFEDGREVVSIPCLTFYLPINRKFFSMKLIVNRRRA